MNPGPATIDDLTATIPRRAIGLSIAVAAVVVTLSLTGCGAKPKAGPAPGAAAAAADEDPVQALQTAVNRRDYRRALQLSQKAMVASPDDPNVLTKRYRRCGQQPVTLWIGRTTERAYAAITT